MNNVTYRAAMIQHYLDRLTAKGYRIGPRSGYLTCVDGVWRNDTWLALRAMHNYR